MAGADASRGGAPSAPLIDILSTEEPEPFEERAALHTANRPLLMTGVMAAMVMQILDTTIANVALPHMQATLGATSDTITWVLTSYIVASAVAIPITGWLADRIGSRVLFLWSVAGFILASMLCGIATSLPEMTLFRILQGVAAAFMNPLSQTVMMDINPPSRQAKAMSIWGMGVMVGPVMGPILGGWLTENYNWRWVFYINVPIGIMAFAILWALLPTRQIARRKFDTFGFSLLAIAIASFQIMLDRGQLNDWFDSWEVRIEGIVALSAAWMFAVHQLTGRNPMFDRSLLVNRTVITGMVFMAVMGVIMMATMALLPPMLQALYGYSVLDTGLLLVPRGIGMVLSMFLASRLIERKTDPRIMVGVGLVIAAGSLWQMTGWTLVMGSMPFIVSGFIQGLGLGLVFMPLNLVTLSSLPGHYRTEAASLMNLSRNIGASVGISVVTGLLARNIQTNHMELGGHITGYSLDAVDPGIASILGASGEMITALMDGEVTRQAAMIAYLDDFKLMMIMTILTIPLAMILRRAKAAPTGDKVHAAFD